MENNFKRFLSLVLALVMVLGMFPMGHVHVHAEENTIRLAVGETHEIVVDVYNAEVVVTDPDVISVETKSTQATHKVLGDITTETHTFEGQYIIASALRYVGSHLTNQRYNDSDQLVSVAENVDATTIWNITPVSKEDGTHDGYYVQDGNGQYLKVNSSGVYIVAEATVLDINWNSTKSAWEIGENDGTQRLNHHNWGRAVTHYGGDNDDGSQWNIYQLKDAPSYAYSVGESVIEFVDGNSYVFVNNRAVNDNKPNTLLSSKASGNKLAFRGTVASFDEASIWTITASGDGYLVQANGGYLTVGDGTAAVTETETVVTFTSSTTVEGAFAIGVNGQYLNNWGNSATEGAGYSNVNDQNSQWFVRPYTGKTPIGTTTVTVTAEKEGEAEITIGGTVYSFTVTANHEHSYTSEVTTPATCVTAGVKTFTCECGDSYTEEIPATGNHTAGEDDGNCSTPVACSVCGQNVVAAKEHVWSEEGTYTEPTTEADGYTTYTCTNEGCTVTNVVINEGSQLGPIVVDPFNKDNWTKISVDSETTKANENANEGEFAQAWDGNTNTKWHSNWRAADGTLGKLKAHGESNAFDAISGEIDFGAEAYINRFSFLPRQDDTGHSNGDGVVTKASLYVKDADDTEWKLVAENVEFTHDQQWKTFEFPAQNVKQVRFEATRSVNDGWVVVSEFDIGYEEEHTYSEEIITQATCNQPGLKRLTCSNGINGADCTCHHTYTVEIPATGEHTYEAVVTDPTCTTAGYTTYTCSVCGDSYVADEVAALGHTPAEAVKEETENGYDMVVYCTVCETELSRESFTNPVEPVLFDIAYTNMSLANDLKIHFAFAQSNVENTEGCYAIILKKNPDGTTEELRVDADDWMSMDIKGAAHYYVTFADVAAKEMTDNFEVTIYNAAGEAISNVYTDSIEKYALRNLEGDNEQYKKVVVDMLNYGAEAQKLARYNLDNLANAQLTEEQMAYATKTVEYKNEMTFKGNGKYLANVRMVSNIQFMMAFSGIDTSMTAVVTFTNWEGKEITKEISGTEFVKNGGYYVITIEETVIADGRLPINCKIYDGETVVAEVTDSIASYAARTTKTPALYEAIMKFSDSALAYLQAK